MPEIVTCPNCNRKLRVPENLLGKNVKCPDCKEAFLAQPEAPSTPPESESPRPSKAGGVSTGKRSSPARSEQAPTPRITRDDDEDHPSRGQDEDHPSRGDETPEDLDESLGGEAVRGGWRSVRLGLSLIIWGIYVSIAAFILGLLSLGVSAILFAIAGASFISALAAALQGQSSNAGTAAGTSLVIGMIMIFVAFAIVAAAAVIYFILSIIAHVLFVYIPSKVGTGRKPLAITQTCLFAAIALLPVASCALYCLGAGASAGTRNAGLGAGGFLGMACGLFIATLCGLAYFFVHMFFLRAVAVGMSSFGLARSIVIMMIVYPVFVILSWVSQFGVCCVGGSASLSFAANSQTPGNASSIMGGYGIAVVVVGLLIFLINFALWIWYFVILHQTRGSISRRLAA